MSFIGNFVSEFSRTEAQLRTLLEQISGLGQKQFAVLIGFPRTSELITKLRKMTEFTPLPGEATYAVSECFKQLDHIIKLRDRLIHYGSHINPLDHSIVVRQKGKPSPFIRDMAENSFTEEELWGAASDLAFIRNTLTYHLNQRLPQDVRHLLLEVVRKREPWLYTPPEQRPDPK